MLLLHRTSRNYRTLAYLAPRLFDKIGFASLVITVFWGIGEPSDCSRPLAVCRLSGSWLAAASAGSWVAKWGGRQSDGPVARRVTN